MELDMTKGSPAKLITKFIIPIIIGNIFQQLYSMVDTIIVGRFVGVDALAAVGATGSVSFLILGFTQGLTTGFTVLTAQRFGAGDREGMRKSIGSAAILSVIVTIVMTAVSMASMDSLLRVMNTPEDIFDMTKEYIMIICAGIACNVLYNLLSSILRAIGNSVVPLVLLVIASVTNIVLDYVLIVYGHMGVGGAAYATIISQGLSGVLCLIYIIKSVPTLHIRPEHCRLESQCVKNQLTVGIPMALQFSITAIGSIMLQSANNALGTACVAAFTSAMRIKMFFICTFESLGIAMATYSGQNYGAGKPERIWLGIKASVLMMIIYAAFTFVLLMSGAKYFALIFVDPSETEILLDTELFLHISCMFFPVLGLLCVLRYTIQGVGFTNLAMFSGVAEMIARILVSLYAVPAFGFLAVCYGDPLAWIAADLFLVPAFIYVYKRLKKQVLTNASVTQAVA